MPTDTPADPSAAKVWLLDPSLIDERSHHFNTVRRVLAEARELDLPCELVGNQAATERVTALPATAHFRIGGYRSADAAHTDRQVVATANAMTLFDLAALAPRMRPQDYVLLPTLTSNLFLGVCQWLAGFAPEHCPRTWLGLTFAPDWHPAGGISPDRARLFDAGFALLPSAHRQRIMFSCETEGLARHYADLAGVRPTVLSLPPLHDVNPPRRPERAGPPTIAFLGYAKREKGAHLLPQIVARVARRAPQTRFTIQLMSHDEAFVAELKGRLASHGRCVTLIEGPMAPEHYHRTLTDSDLVLLPYDPRTYRLRGSGVMAEARTLGIPMVAPANTDIGAQLRSGGSGRTFDQFNASNVAEAVLAALDELDQLRARALAVSETGAPPQAGYLHAVLAHFADGGALGAAPSTGDDTSADVQR